MLEWRKNKLTILSLIIIFILFIADTVLVYVLYKSYKLNLNLQNEIHMLKSLIEWKDANDIKE